MPFTIQIRNGANTVVAGKNISDVNLAKIGTWLDETERAESGDTRTYPEMLLDKVARFVRQAVGNQERRQASQGVSESEMLT